MVVKAAPGFSALNKFNNALRNLLSLHPLCSLLRFLVILHHAWLCIIKACSVGDISRLLECQRASQRSRVTFSKGNTVNADFPSVRKRKAVYTPRLTCTVAFKVMNCRSQKRRGSLKRTSTYTHTQGRALCTQRECVCVCVSFTVICRDILWLVCVEFTAIDFPRGREQTVRQ